LAELGVGGVKWERMALILISSLNEIMVSKAHPYYSNVPATRHSDSYFAISPQTVERTSRIAWIYGLTYN
jgi:hypothetical protein